MSTEKSQELHPAGPWGQDEKSGLHPEREESHQKDLRHVMTASSLGSNKMAQLLR